MAGIDTSVSSDYAVEQTAITLSTVLGAMKYGSVRTGLIILDACRNNPFEGLGTSRGMSDDLDKSLPQRNAYRFLDLGRKRRVTATGDVTVAIPKRS